MSATQEWIKEEFAKDSPRIINEYALQRQVDELAKRVRTLEEDLAWRQKERG
jgi:hypothetical protein